MNAKMKGPEGHSGLSYAGVSYEPDADGFVEIPQEAVSDALNHGFTIADNQASEESDGENKGGKKNGKKPA